MNRYPLWKNLLILAAVVTGFIYALPNIYAPDPAIQITGVRGGITVDDSVMTQATKRLDEENIRYFGVEVTENTGLIRFYAQDDQFVARRLVQQELGPQNYVVAFNRAATTPDWLVSMGARPMNLGLDLSGGVHFLLEVDTEQVLTREMESVEDVLRRKIREENLRGVSARASEGQIVITAETEELREAMIPILRNETPELVYERAERAGKFLIRAQFSDAYIREKESYAVQQNLTTLRNRVNEIGVSEPLVQTQGRNRIVVQLPGIQDTARAKNILGKTANLEFRLAADASTLPSQREEFEYRDPEQQRLRGSEVLQRRHFLTGERVTNAQVGFDPDTGFPQITTAIMAGDIQAGFMVPGIAMPQVRTDKVRALAITSLEPSTLLPGIPTMASQGFPDFESISWNALFVPAGTPEHIIERLNESVTTSLKDDAVIQKMEMLFFTPQPSSPQEMTQRIKSEKVLWDGVIERLGLSLDQ